MYKIVVCVLLASSFGCTEKAKRFYFNLDGDFVKDSDLCSNSSTWISDDLEPTYGKLYNFIRPMSSTPKDPSCIASVPIKLSKGIITFDMYDINENNFFEIVIKPEDKVKINGDQVLYKSNEWQNVNIDINVIGDNYLTYTIILFGAAANNNSMLIKNISFIPHLSQNNRNNYETVPYNVDKIPLENENEEEDSFWNVLSIMGVAFLIILMLILICVFVYDFLNTLINGPSPTSLIPRTLTEQKKLSSKN